MKLFGTIKNLPRFFGRQDLEMKSSLSISQKSIATTVPSTPTEKHNRKIWHSLSANDKINYAIEVYETTKDADILFLAGIGLNQAKKIGYSLYALREAKLLFPERYKEICDLLIHDIENNQSSKIDVEFLCQVINNCKFDNNDSIYLEYLKQKYPNTIKHEILENTLEKSEELHKKFSAY